MLLAAGLLLTLQATELPDYKDLPNEEMEARLRACGLTQVTAFYDDSSQGKIVEVADSEANDEQLRCAAKALDMTFHFALFKGDLMQRFQEFSAELTRPRAVAQAEAYFAERPELGELPQRKDGETDIVLARRLEKFCGPAAVGLFTDQFGMLSVGHDWLQRPAEDFAKRSEVFGCVFQAAVLVDLEFGFIGIDRYSVEEQSPN